MSVLAIDTHMRWVPDRGPAWGKPCGCCTRTLREQALWSPQHGFVCTNCGEAERELGETSTQG